MRCPLITRQIALFFLTYWQEKRYATKPNVNWFKCAVVVLPIWTHKVLNSCIASPHNRVCKYWVYAFDVITPDTSSIILKLSTNKIVLTNCHFQQSPFEFTHARFLLCRVSLQFNFLVIPFRITINFTFNKGYQRWMNMYLYCTIVPDLFVWNILHCEFIIFVSF